MKRLSQRDITLLASGLIVGLVIGMLLIATDLLGTAGSKDDNELVYYRVSFDNAQKWLQERYEALDNDNLGKSMEELAKLPSDDVFIESDDPKTTAPYIEAETHVQTVLKPMYAALIGADDFENFEDSDKDTVACLMLDDDFYNPSLYLRLTLTPNQADKVDIPDDWEELAKPKKTMLDLTLTCYPESKAGK